MPASPARRKGKSWRVAAAVVLGALLAVLAVGGLSAGTLAADPAAPDLAAPDLAAPGGTGSIGRLPADAVRQGPVAFLAARSVDRRVAGAVRSPVAVLAVVAVAVALVASASVETRLLAEVASRPHRRSPRGPPRT